MLNARRIAYLKKNPAIETFDTGPPRGERRTNPAHAKHVSVAISHAIRGSDRENHARHQ